MKKLICAALLSSLCASVSAAVKDTTPTVPGATPNQDVADVAIVDGTTDLSIWRKRKILVPR